MKIKCSNCKSINVAKRGFRKTQNRGLIQRYYCNDCKKRFVINDGFFRMRNSPQKITLCLDLFYRGISTRKVQEHLQTFYPHNSSNVSIYNWVTKYPRMISKFTNSLKLNVGSEVQIDEVEYHRRKNHKKKEGVEKNWFIDSIDVKTKFMVASNYCKSREMEEIKPVIKQIKEKTGNQFTKITTDGWGCYPKAIEKVYYYKNVKKGLVVHNRNIHSDEGMFNYPIERLHNSVRARTKTFRGFHGSIESANSLMKGIEVYYNFITKHQTLDCSPYELAIPTLKLENPNKWLDLIRISTQNK